MLVKHVNLKRGWFSPQGDLLEPTGNPHLYLPSWEGKLPSSAELVEVGEPDPPKPVAKVAKE